MTAASCSDRPVEGAAKGKAAPPAPVPSATMPPLPANTTVVATKSVLNGPLKAPFTRTTLSGIYTADEAKEGSTLYMGFCASCHAAVSHTGPEFRKKWAGRPLADLYDFMHTNMPKNDPASLDDYQYGV